MEREAVFGLGFSSAHGSPQHWQEKIAESRLLKMSLENLARDDQRYIDRHLRGTPQMQRELRRTGSAHVFVDEAMLHRVEQKLLQNGIFTGRVRGADQYGYLFDDVIGYRIDLKGSETPLYYGELKVKDGRYHAIPRTKASY